MEDNLETVETKEILHKSEFPSAQKHAPHSSKSVFDNSLIDKIKELKERFLREEITAEEYTKLKDEIERELERLEKEEERKKVEKKMDFGKKENEVLDKNMPTYKHKIISKESNNSVVWKYLSAILAVILIISLGVNFGLFKLPFSKTAADKTVVADKVINFVNANLLSDGVKASLQKIEERNGIYLLKLNVNGQAFDSYTTKDGSLFFPSAIDLAAGTPKNTGSDTNTNTVDVSPEDDASLGSANASVEIIEFSDYQCPFCARAEPTIKQILETYKDEVRFVYRDFPLSFHQYAQKAAEASECADEQGKFWEYHNILFERQSEWSAGGVDKLKGYAQNLSLDTKKFNECLDSGKMASEVQKDFEDGQKAGVSGTPAFFINGVSVSGAQPFSVFKQIIDQELNK